MIEPSRRSVAPRLAWTDGRRALAAAACLALPAAPAMALFEVPGFELVCTAPVETTLREGNLRSAADVWPQMFDEARRSIDIAQFYITPKPGEPLDPVLDALGRAAGRGVRVRFLLEKKFEHNSKEGIERLRAIKGVEVRVMDFSAVSPDGIIHAKYFVVDGGEAYVGSQNFDWRSLKHIRELGLRITDKAVVRDISAVFELDWRDQPLAAAMVRKGRGAGAAEPAAGEPGTGAAGPAAMPGKPVDLRKAPRAFLAASPPHRLPPGVRPAEDALVALLDSATKEIAVEVLHYAPLDRKKRFYPRLDNAIRSAQARGVRVRLLVSHWNIDKPDIAHLKSLSLLPGVEVRIATIPEAREGPIPFSRVNHAKFAVVDGKVLWLGTSNWTGGYMDRSRNLEVAVMDEALAGRVLDLHAELWNSSYAAPIELNRDYPEPRR